MRLWIGPLVLVVAFFEQGRAQGEECAMMQTKDYLTRQAAKPEQQPSRSDELPGDDKTISKAAWGKALESWKRAGEVDHIRHGMKLEPAQDARPVAEEDMKSKIAEVRQAQEEFIRATDMWRRAGEVTKDEPR
ncbi:unnamed protein product [Symbiodinium sp. CCMP2456]|nr:unnamed protein product [Symbiodinium sp. CCMP2456]